MDTEIGHNKGITIKNTKKLQEGIDSLYDNGAPVFLGALGVSIGGLYRFFAASFAFSSVYGSRLSGELFPLKCLKFVFVARSEYGRFAVGTPQGFQFLDDVAHRRAGPHKLDCHRHEILRLVLCDCDQFLEQRLYYLIVACGANLF